MGRFVTGVVVGLVALGASGCGFLGEELAERTAEQVTGADIEVDEDGISVQSDEGGFTVDAEDGTMTMETDDGTFESAQGQVPEDFPSDIPLVDGGELVMGSRFEDAESVYWSVNWQFDAGDPAEVFAAQVAALEAAGFTRDPEGDFSMGEGGEGMSSAILGNGTHDVHLSTLGGPDDFVVGYQVFEAMPEEG